MFCETEAEAFADSSRELIFQVARGYLERRGITTTELTFDPVQHRALLDDGARFQEILQRVALVQGRHTRRPVSERMKELTALAEAAMRRVAAQAARLPSVGSVAAALEQGLFAGAALDEWVRGGVAFSRLLSGCDGWSSQVMLCIDMLDAGIQAESRAMADQTLAEILRLKPAASAVYGERNERRALIQTCLFLAGAEGELQTAAALRLRDSGHLADLPQSLAALREHLAEALGGSQPLFSDNPQEEWQATVALKQKIRALPLLADDAAIATALDRRVARFAAPELLNPILACEPDIARKLLFLIALHREVDDEATRFELLGVLGHYLDHRDFKSQFVGRQATRDEFANLAASISGALVQADIPDQRKTRLLELFRNQLSTVVKPVGQRTNQRGMGGAHDAVEVAGVKMALRNWSPAGLLFGPCPPGIVIGDRMPISVTIRNSALTLDFSADAEVLRITDGLVAARYACADPAVMQRIKDFFS